MTDPDGPGDLSPGPDRSTRPRRVLTGGISHETNTFNTIPTTLDAFRRGTLLFGDAIIRARRGTDSAMGATFDAADRYGWTLIHPVLAAANPSGTVTDDTHEHLLAPLLDGARQGVDGVLLHLHGAMVTESQEDAEGDMLRRLRAILGPNIPVVVTLDLHGNITEAMAEAADALIAVRTYPHIDHPARATQGATLLQRAMDGEIRPRTVVARRPMLRGLDYGRTQSGPMRTLIDRGEALERDGTALVVSVCAGFTAADIHDIGPSVTVTVDANRPGALDQARAIAGEFMDHAWETREHVSIPEFTIADAVALAQAGQHQARRGAGDTAGPLVLADVTDNPGSGHYGDTTDLLRAMLAADLVDAAFYAIHDPEAVQAAIAIGIGNIGRITFGGRHDPAAGGGPLTVEVRVATLTDGRFRAWGPMGGGVARDMGPSARITVGGVDIALITNNGQATDLAQLTSLGLDPTRLATIAVKSRHHFRAAFTPIAREIVNVNGGGLGAAVLAGARYRRTRRPIWPLDADVGGKESGR